MRMQFGDLQPIYNSCQTFAEQLKWKQSLTIGMNVPSAEEAVCTQTVLRTRRH